MTVENAALVPADSSLSPQLAVWEFAGLLLTYWCNSRCACCYVYAGPEHERGMDVPTALSLWRGLDELAASHGKAMRVHLAGGEPFGDWVRLVSIIRAARDAGLTRVEKVETNAYWAVNDGLTRARLELLDALGVGKLVVSTDVFHQEFVPFERVRRCVEIARRVLGPGRVTVRWWDFLQEPVDTGRLTPAEKDDAFRAALARHKDRLTGRAAAEIADLLPCLPASAFQGQSCIREVLHSRHVHIDADGTIFPGTCAGIILGRVSAPDRTVAEIWCDLAANWPAHPIIGAVVAGGSHELLQRVKALGYHERPAGYASKCHLCFDIRHFLAECHLWPAFVGPPQCYGLAPKHVD